MVEPDDTKSYLVLVDTNRRKYKSIHLSDRWNEKTQGRD